MTDRANQESIGVEKALYVARQAGWQSWHNDEHEGIGNIIEAMSVAMLDALRSQPVEQRMEAMGMQRIPILDGDDEEFDAWVEAPEPRRCGVHGCDGEQGHKGDHWFGSWFPPSEESDG